jgi:uncharacterized cupin superfamily protein
MLHLPLCGEVEIAKQFRVGAPTGSHVVIGKNQINRLADLPQGGGELTDEDISMPKIDIKSVPERKGSSYPAPFHLKAGERIRQRLGDAGGLSDFGVNLMHLPPGAWSSQRHWHSAEDEFVFVVSGELALVTDRGEEILRAGDCAAFPKGAPDGHHLINRSTAVAVALEIGSRSSVDICTYSDIDMKVDARDDRYTHKDGTPYPERNS